MTKIRLDQLVVQRGLAPSREAARRLILAGQIRSGSLVLDKPGRSVAEDMPLEFRGARNPYVSRGGLKLAHALGVFGLSNLAGMRALDIGTSTGGFTDCMLQHGARQVISVDTGKGKIHEKLRNDPRVTLLENTNARNLALSDLDGYTVDFIAIDVSFISLRLILPPCVDLLADAGKIVVLLKPQFEAGRGQVGSGGVVRDSTVHAEVVRGFLAYCADHGWLVEGLSVSPILGGEGNVEFLVLLSRTVNSNTRGVSENQIETVLSEAYNLQNSEAPQAQGAESK